MLEIEYGQRYHDNVPHCIATAVHRSGKYCVLVVGNLENGSSNMLQSFTRSREVLTRDS